MPDQSHVGRRYEARGQVVDPARAGAMATAIAGPATPFEPEGIEGVYHLYVIRIERGRRHELQTFLAEHDIQTGIHYPAPIHRTPAFAPFSSADCLVAEKYSRQILSLPMYPGLERRELEYVASRIGKYIQAGLNEMVVRS